VSDADIVRWCREQLEILEQRDREFAKDEEALILGGVSA